MTKYINYNFLQKLKSLPCIEEIYLYGSRARGDNLPRFDIDLAIVAPHATKEEWSKIMQIIENADTLLEIDEQLRKNILIDHKILYKKD